MAGGACLPRRSRHPPREDETVEHLPRHSSFVRDAATSLAYTMLLVAVAIPSPSAAQPPISFAELASRVSVDDRIRLEDRSGATTVGRVKAITSEAVTVESGAAEIRFTSEMVRSVAKRRSWTLLGTLIGAAGLTAYALVDCQKPKETCGDWAMGTLLGAGLGALVGANIHTMAPVYRGPARLEAVLPASSHPEFGVRVSARW
jgi:hypothetical protein